MMKFFSAPIFPENQKEMEPREISALCLSVPQALARLPRGAKSGSGSKSRNGTVDLKAMFGSRYRIDRDRAVSSAG